MNEVKEPRGQNFSKFQVFRHLFQEASLDPSRQEKNREKRPFEMDKL